jgi:shikimate dehydrogenase
LAQAGAQLEGARVLVLGAGGAARAGVFAALSGGARAVEVANRTYERAEALVDSVQDSRCAALAFTTHDLQAALDGADVLLQCTSAGMGDPNVSALPAGLVLPAQLIVLDMVYRPIETALLRQARDNGCRTVDGLWMLVHQALEQFRLWTGQDAPEPTARALHQHLLGAAT